MAWEERSGSRYYYRKVWRGGTCHSEYVGRGWPAQLASLADSIEQHQHTIARLKFEDFRQAQRLVGQAIDNYRHHTSDLVAGALQQAGFHQHKGQWRKARNLAENLSSVHTMRQEFNALFRAAQKTQKGVESENFKKYAQEHPNLFDSVSLLAQSTIQLIMDSTEMSETTKVCVTEELHALRRSLGVVTATPIEKLLIDEIAICWLRMQFTEQLYSENLSVKGVTLAKAEYLERHLSATRKRYLQAVESLARVRRLIARSVVQLNVAEQQVVVNGR